MCYSEIQLKSSLLDLVQHPNFAADGRERQWLYGNVENPNVQIKRIPESEKKSLKGIFGNERLINYALKFLLK